MKRTLLLLSSIAISISIGLALLSILKGVSADSQSVTIASSSKHEDLSTSLPLTNSEPFELLGEVNGGQINHVAVSGTYAYVNIDDRLAVLDVMTPTAITLIDQSIKFDGGIYQITIHNHHLFVLTSASGLHIFDLNNPSKPHEVGSFPLDPGGIVFQGNYFYRGAEDNFARFDISKPSAPVLVWMGRSATGDTFSYPAWTLSDQRLIIANSYSFGANDYLNTISIFRIADPLDPVPFPDVQTRDSVRSVPNLIFARGTQYFTGNSRLTVYDAADPSNIITVTTTQLGLPGYSDWIDASLAIEHNGYLYIAGREYNTNHQIDTIFQIVDISNAAAPVARGGIATAHPIQGMAATDKYVYIADGAFHIIDVHNPQVPVIVSTYGTVGYDIAASNIIIAQAGYIYLADREFHVVDIRDPASPRVVGRYSPLGSATSLAISGTRAYLNLSNQNGEKWLRILDISDPTNPTRLGYLLPNDAVSSQVVGERLYSVNESGLNIVDVSQPLTPTLAGMIATPFAAKDLAVIGNYAYLVLADGNLRIADLTKQALDSSWVTSATAIQMEGNRLYTQMDDTTQLEHTIHVFDVHNPIRPKEVSSYCFGATGGWTVDGDWLFALDTWTYFHPTGWTLAAYDLRQPKVQLPVGRASFFDYYGAIETGSGLIIVRKGQSLQLFDFHEGQLTGAPVYEFWPLGIDSNDNWYVSFVNYPVYFWTYIFPMPTYPLTITYQRSGLPPIVQILEQPNHRCWRERDSRYIGPVSWPTPGTQLISITAENSAGTAIATATVQILGVPPLTVTPSSGAALPYCDLRNYGASWVNYCPIVLDFPAGAVTQTTQIQMTPYYSLTYPFDKAQLQEGDAQWVTPIRPLHKNWKDPVDQNLESFTIEASGSQVSGAEMKFSRPFSTTRTIVETSVLSEVYDTTQFHLRRWNGKKWERVATVVALNQTSQFTFDLIFQIQQTGLYSLFGELAHERRQFLPLITNN